MATKRDLKKLIRDTCGGLALEMISAGDIFKSIDPKDVEQIVYECALLQAGTLSRLSIAYDRTPADFATRHEYAHDRRAYFAKAYKALMADFWQKVEEIISHMHAALPDDVRAILKKAADA